MKLVVWLVGGVAGVILLAALVLSAMTMRPGAGGSQNEIEIASSPAKIWPWLSDGQKAKKWVSWLVEVRPAGPNKEIWVMEDKNNGGERMEIEGTLLKSDFPRSLTVGLKAPGFEGGQTYVLTDLGGGRTRLAVDFRYRFEQMFSRLMEPVITPAASKKMRDDLAKLKTVVESGETTASR